MKIFHLIAYLLTNKIYLPGNLDSNNSFYVQYSKKTQQYQIHLRN